jgi:HTH-type transcriptional regulator/antitoxin HigA
MIKSLIKSEAEYEHALKRIEALMGSLPETPAFDELELLSAVVELYEEAHHPVLPPDPIDAIKFRIEQSGLKPKDLVPVLGSRGKVSEVLSGKRPLSLNAIRALHKKLNIPAEILLRERQAPEKSVPHPEKFPWKEIVKRNWLAPVFRGNLKRAIDNAEELSLHLLRNLTKSDIEVALFRRNVRGEKFDPHALLAWTAYIVNKAKDTICPVKYSKGAINDDFMRALVSFSLLEEGPRLAGEFLLKSGIVLIVEPHLSRTHVDGAATMLKDGTPVIGLSIRHDRVDNFWFCLCHELAHVRLHLERHLTDWYVDDLDFSDGSQHENEADDWAQAKLIPPEHWGLVKNCQTPAEVEDAARKLHIHPGIVAGRLRYERKNYKLFSRLVGHGEIRKQFFAE